MNVELINSIFSYVLFIFIFQSSNIFMNSFSFSIADLTALNAVMQTYLMEDMWKYINSLPRWPGAAMILDDNLEKIFTVNIRPRMSWHAGGTAIVI